VPDVAYRLRLAERTEDYEDRDWWPTPYPQGSLASSARTLTDMQFAG
jgi:hypothetical protein